MAAEATPGITAVIKNKLVPNMYFFMKLKLTCPKYVLAQVSVNDELGTMGG
jgi:hypothetical protein